MSLGFLSRTASVASFMAARAVSALTPPVCIACNCCFSPSRGRGWLSLCPSCTGAAFTPQTRCRQCGFRLGPRLQAFGWTRCRHCRAAPTGTRTWVGADYLPPFDTLPKALKFRGQQALARDMGVALAHAFVQARDLAGGGKGSIHASAEKPDCFIPVPVSARRLRERGYNQALLIARSLGKTLNVPVKAGYLLKTLDTGRQAELTASQRQDNLAGAFICVGDVEGLHVGLVDDVLTTGATLSVCEQTLLQAGAASVSRWVAFRTPEKPEPIEP